MEIFELKVTRRNKTGKEHAKKLRREEIVPGVLYQHGEESIAVELPKRDLFGLVSKHAGENLVLKLLVDGKEERNALISELQTHPVSDEILHVDFHGISMKEKVVVKVAVHEKGESPGVVEGGILDHVNREVEVECLPTNIPEKFEVDISELNIGDSIHVSDLTMPQGVECLSDPESVLLSVLAPKQEEEAPAEEAEEGAAEPEVIKKGKEDTEEEGGGEGDGAPQGEQKGE